MLWHSLRSKNDELAHIGLCIGSLDSTQSGVPQGSILYSLSFILLNTSHLIRWVDIVTIHIWSTIDNRIDTCTKGVVVISMRGCSM